jgi:hypothetical protein
VGSSLGAHGWVESYRKGATLTGRVSWAWKSAPVAIRAIVYEFDPVGGVDVITTVSGAALCAAPLVRTVRSAHQAGQGFLSRTFRELL